MPTNPDLLQQYLQTTALFQFLNSEINRVVPSPIIPHLSISQEWATPAEVNILHEELCGMLNIADVKQTLQWNFNKRFKSLYGQAEYPVVNGVQIWRIQYASRYWLLLSNPERKNLITHEMCHLAVERHFGYDKVINGKKVTAHGTHWKKLMEKCGEDPAMVYKEELGSAELSSIANLNTLIAKADQIVGS